jgi:hypothetical protein
VQEKTKRWGRTTDQGDCADDIEQWAEELARRDAELIAKKNQEVGKND